MEIRYGFDWGYIVVENNRTVVRFNAFGQPMNWDPKTLKKLFSGNYEIATTVENSASMVYFSSILNKDDSVLIEIRTINPQGLSHEYGLVPPKKINISVEDKKAVLGVIDAKV